jgi:hypothetical protein
VGSYHWTADYNLSGSDGNNNSASDNGSSTQERLTVNPASPTIVTTANPTGTIYAGTTAPTLKDSAIVSGGYYPTGTVTFYLFKPGTTLFSTANAIYSETDPLSLVTNVSSPDYGKYKATTATGYNQETLTGTYQWEAFYNNDGNNNPASDTSLSTQEQVTINDQVVNGEAATLGFWANKNGQALLGTYGVALGNWLGGTYAHLFGNLSGATGCQVATYFACVAKASASGVVNNTYAQALTTALDVWVTTMGLGWNTTATGPTKYGFKQGFGGLGLGDVYYNVGNNYASFGVVLPNTDMKVSDLLAYFNSKCSRPTSGNGSGSYTTLPTFTFYATNDPTLLNGANNVFCGITNTGDIN